MGLEKRLVVQNECKDRIIKMARVRLSQPPCSLWECIKIIDLRSPRLNHKRV